MLSALLSLSYSALAGVAEFFAKENLQTGDAIYVVEGQSPVFAQNIEQVMIPASLTKLATVYLAIQNWGLDHHFTTAFYRQGNALLVKGYGDPFLVSEELPLLAAQLKATGLDWVEEIWVDDSHIAQGHVPGRSQVADPYNAPLSAVAINFNTAKLKNNGGQYTSAEKQTPLTSTAVAAARQLGRPAPGKRERINLIDRDKAQTHFAELLATALTLQDKPIKINQALHPRARLIYQHKNSKALSDILRGTLEFSNNFMANQLFLQFDQQAPLDFDAASAWANQQLEQQFAWQGHKIDEGSGLYRGNRLSAAQLDQLLQALADHKILFEQYKTSVSGVSIRAKSGTLDGVRSLAGYIDFANTSYRFVFIFNRTVPYAYREQLLQRLVKHLAG